MHKLRIQYRSDRISTAFENTFTWPNFPHRYWSIILIFPNCSLKLYKWKNVGNLFILKVLRLPFQVTAHFLVSVLRCFWRDFFSGPIIIFYPHTNSVTGRVNSSLIDRFCGCMLRNAISLFLLEVPSFDMRFSQFGYFIPFHLNFYFPSDDAGKLI